MKISLVTALIGLVLVVTVVQAVQLSNLEENVTGLAVGSTGELDMSGWTADEKMNYEMHGTIPARASKRSSSTAGVGMVGGC